MPQAAGQPLRDVAEELVSGVVAEAVVDHLEVVQVHEEQTGGLPSVPERVLQPVLEQGPVRQAGQRVVERLLGQLLLVQRPLGDVTVVEDQTADGGVVKKVGGRHLEMPGHLHVLCQPTLLLRGQGLEIVEAPVDQRTERDELPARCRVALLDGGFAQVVGFNEQLPDRLDALGLLDGLLAEFLERRDREAERDQSCRGNRRDRQEHGPWDSSRQAQGKP